MTFNLDLSKYSIRDLKRMFRLGDTYSTSELEEKTDAIHTQLVTGTMDELLKGNLTRFLQEAKALLGKEVMSSGIPPPPLYVPTKQEEFVAGALNPYEKRTQTKCVCIDTTFQIGQLATDFVYVLPESVKNVVSMKLAAVELPNTINTFPTEGNTIKINVVNAPVKDLDGNSTVQNISVVLVLNPGVYAIQTTSGMMITSSGPDPAAELNAKFNANGLQYLIAEVTSTRTTIRFRTQFDFPPNFDTIPPDTTFSLAFDTPNSRIAGWTLGFRKPTYASVNGSIESDAPFSTPNYVFLEVEDFNNNFQTDTVISTNSASSPFDINYSGNAANYMGKNLLARMALGMGPFTVVQCYTNEVFRAREYFGPVRIDKLRFRLLNRLGNVIDLLGSDFSFVLEFTTIYG